MTDKPEYRLPGIRTFELLLGLTGWPSTVTDNGMCKMDDLPANLQDAVLEGLERKSIAEGLPLAIVLVRVDIDHDKREDEPGYYYLHVVASEVVVVPKGPLH